MDIKKLFTETFKVELARSLPMKDAYFTADLQSRGLFPGDLKEEVSGLSTRAQQVNYFLEKTAETGNADSFLQLLAAMETFSPSLKDLAQKIKAKFPQSSPSKSVHTLCHLCCTYTTHLISDTKIMTLLIATDILGY